MRWAAGIGTGEIFAKEIVHWVAAGVGVTNMMCMIHTQRTVLAVLASR
jgi:hypothetical protein